MRQLCAAALVWSLLALHALGQVEVKAATYLKLEGAKGVRQIADHVLLPADAQIEYKPVGIVVVETAAANIEVSISDQNRVPVTAKELQRGVYCIEQSGKFWVDVTAIDFKANIYARRQLVLEVGPQPAPPTPPGPGPDPNPPGPGPSPDSGEFDNIAGKLRAASANMQPDKKYSLANVFEIAASKLATREFLQLSQASSYITANSPPCTPSSGCKPVYDLLANDARSRTLSIQQAILYYREIAKGLR